ncbi:MULTISPECIES: hypothetical protein [Streptomyces]|uniref:hypothetical protein n=1 Tax=Streptomyces TaxID=1883 RepID=UPI0033A25F9C
MIARLPVTLALSKLLADATKRPVGRSRKPLNTAPPYYLLDSIVTILDGAPFTDRNEDASFIYQVTSVSGPDPKDPDSFGVADQAEYMADKAREAFLGRNPATGLWLYTLTIPGARNIARSLDIEAGATNDPGDAIMSYVQRFRFDLTSA